MLVFIGPDRAGSLIEVVSSSGTVDWLSVLVEAAALEPHVVVEGLLVHHVPVTNLTSVDRTRYRPA